MHDIFIRDKDQNNLDDKTGKPVEVVAMVDSVIIGTEEGWKRGSNLRGGNVIWLYNPSLDMVFYYAHLDQISVKRGDVVKGGTVLGTIGRTGAAASEKRSPTHLHHMVLKYENRILNPYNYYSELAKNHR